MPPGSSPRNFIPQPIRTNSQKFQYNEKPVIKRPGHTAGHGKRNITYAKRTIGLKDAVQKKKKKKMYNAYLQNKGYSPVLIP